MRSTYSSLRFHNLLRRYIGKLFVLRRATTLLNIFLTNYAYLKELLLRMRSRCSTLRFNNLLRTY
jgi:hypothetical protein